MKNRSQSSPCPDSLRIAGRAGLFAALALAAIFSVSCSRDGGSQAKPGSIAVFVPGVVSGSPIYEMLVAGVQKAAAESKGSTVKVLEGGTDQAQWPEKLTSLAATGQYRLIVTSNPAMPEICAGISEKFPAQKFLILDGKLEGNKSIATVMYNQREQGYFDGYLAGLITKKLVKNGKPHRIGLVAAQEYPVMNEIIKPGYEEGAKAADPAVTVDFRVVGNWYDAAKATELANGMFANGVEVVLTIAGGANQGVVAAAKQKDRKVLWFDTNGYATEPGVIVGSAVILQDKAAYGKVKSWLDGKLEFGKAEVVGLKDGFVDFVQDDPLYLKAVPEDVRKAQGAMLESVRSGSLSLPVQAAN
jgi:riboflavin transport system substrate-binding protein